MEPQITETLKNLRERIRNSVDYNKKQIKLGKFILLERLGGGNYGDVYKAYHEQTQKYFAVKIIDKTQLFADTVNPYVRQVLTRLLKSQDILMKICDSPNVLKCYETMENNRYKIFILEYCRNGSLHDQLKKRDALPVVEALAVLKQIINGLAELHRNKIIHRDLKAENIMKHNGVYKIADFGFSRKIDDENMIGKFTVLGTRTTMAPEVRKHMKYGIKADIWSLGIIFYMMISTSIPYNSQGFTGRSKDIFTQIRQLNLAQNRNKSLYFRTREGPADEELQNFIRQMLTIDQAKRISWRELVNHKIFRRCDQTIFERPILNLHLERQQTTQIDIQDNFLKKHQDKLPTIQLLQQRKEIKKEQQKAKNQQKITNNDLLPQTNTLHSIESEIGQELDDDLTKEINQLSNFASYKLKSDIDVARYKKIQENNVQCLKAKYFYESIVLQLEKKKMLDLSRRSHNQLLYLIITRCFINVSWAENNLEKNGDDEMFLNHHQQIKFLYNKIKKKWDQIQISLRNVCNQLKYRFLDAKDKVVSPSYMEEIFLYFQGIQGIDYSKEQQVKYTQDNYIQKILKELKGEPKPLEIIRSKLRAYKKVNQITFQDVVSSGKNFQELLVQVVKKVNL